MGRRVSRQVGRDSRHEKTDTAADLRCDARVHMLECPHAASTLRDCDISRLDRVQDAAAVTDRVRGLDRIVIALLDVSLKVFQLTAERGFDRRPGGCRDQPRRHSSGEADVATGPPVRAVDCPRCVATLWIQRMGRRLAASRVSRKHIPDVPIDPVLSPISASACSSLLLVRSSGTRSTTANVSRSPSRRERSQWLSAPVVEPTPRWAGTSPLPAKRPTTRRCRRRTRRATPSQTAAQPVGHRNVANARAQYGGPRREDRALLDPDGWPCGFRASASWS
jgi:hypothetical protein